MRLGAGGGKASGSRLPCVTREVPVRRRLQLDIGVSCSRASVCYTQGGKLGQAGSERCNSALLQWLLLSVTQKPGSRWTVKMGKETVDFFFVHRR